MVVMALNLVNSNISTKIDSKIEHSNTSYGKDSQPTNRVTKDMIMHNK